MPVSEAELWHRFQNVRSPGDRTSHNLRHCELSEVFPNVFLLQLSDGKKWGYTLLGVFVISLFGVLTVLFYFFFVQDTKDAMANRQIGCGDDDGCPARKPSWIFIIGVSFGIGCMLGDGVTVVTVVAVMLSCRSSTGLCELLLKFTRSCKISRTS
eukprot:gene12846-3761_t